MGQAAFGRNVRRHRSDGDVITVHWSEPAVIGGVRGIKESIAVQIVASRSFAQVVEPSEQGKILGDLVHVIRAAARHGAKFALTNKALSKIRIQGEIVGAKKTCELQLLAATKLPGVIQCHQRGMGLVLLPRVDRVAVVAEIGIGGIRGKDRDQSGDVGKTVVANSKQRKAMVAGVKRSLAIEFVLLPMFQSIEESVAIGGRERNPRFGSGA